jgi:hypothetical protein
MKPGRNEAGVGKGSQESPSASARTASSFLNPYVINRMVQPDGPELAGHPNFDFFARNGIRYLLR